MNYYSISYRIFPRPPREDFGDECETFFLFESENKLDDAGRNYALEYYLKDKKENYTDLVISESKEITEQEYIDITQYS